MTRLTKTDFARATETLTAELHSRGILHPDATLESNGRNGYYALDVSGGPHYGTGTDNILTGTLRECTEAVWAVSRTLELGHRSFGRWL
jgi:hypothetical protein